MWPIKGFDHLYIQYIYTSIHIQYLLLKMKVKHMFEKKNHFEQSLYIYHVGGK